MNLWKKYMLHEIFFLCFLIGTIRVGFCVWQNIISGTHLLKTFFKCKKWKVFSGAKCDLKVRLCALAWQPRGGNLLTWAPVRLGDHLHSFESSAFWARSGERLLSQEAIPWLLQRIHMELWVTNHCFLWPESYLVWNSGIHSEAFGIYRQLQSGHSLP